MAAFIAFAGEKNHGLKRADDSLHHTVRKWLKERHHEYYGKSLNILVKCPVFGLALTLFWQQGMSLALQSSGMLKIKEQDIDYVKEVCRSEKSS